MFFYFFTFAFGLIQILPTPNNYSHPGFIFVSLPYKITSVWLRVKIVH